LAESRTDRGHTVGYPQLPDPDEPVLADQVSAIEANVAMPTAGRTCLSTVLPEPVRDWIDIRPGRSTCTGRATSRAGAVEGGCGRRRVRSRLGDGVVTTVRGIGYRLADDVRARIERD
jgi:hypothetical protein